MLGVDKVRGKGVLIKYGMITWLKGSVESAK